MEHFIPIRTRLIIATCDSRSLDTSQVTFFYETNKCLVSTRGAKLEGDRWGGHQYTRHKRESQCNLRVCNVQSS